MIRLIRRPLIWMVAAECLVVTAFGVFTWSLVAGHRPPPAGLSAPPDPLRRLPAGPAPAPKPSLSATAGVTSAPHPAGGPTPGLRQDAGFASRLNSDSAGWESAQWRLTSAVIAWTRRYLDGVVVPAILRAEQRGRGPAPSPPPRAGPTG